MTSKWLASLLPERLALRALRIELRGPDTVVVSHPTEFVVTIENRLPVPVSITLPTSRLWGWTINDIPEADDRGYKPPQIRRTVRFNSRERRVAVLTWDGTIRRSGDDGDVWSDYSGGCTLTVFVAVNQWKSSGLYDSRDITVTPG